VVRILSGKKWPQRRLFLATCPEHLAAVDVGVSFLPGHCNFSCMEEEHTQEPRKIYGTGAESSHPCGNVARTAQNIIPHAKVFKCPLITEFNICEWQLWQTCWKLLIARCLYKYFASK